MSKYIKLEDAIMVMDEWFSELTAHKKLLSELPTIEVSEDCISKVGVISELSLYRKTVEVSITPRVSAVASIVIDTINDCIKMVENAPTVVPIAEQYATDGEVDLMKMRG